MGGEGLRRIRLIIEDNVKSLRLKSNMEKDLVTAIYFSEAPRPPILLSWRGLEIL